MRGNSIVRFIGELRRKIGLACDRGPTFTTDCIRLAAPDPKETCDFLQSGHRAITLSALAGTTCYWRFNDDGAVDHTC